MFNVSKITLSCSQTRTTGLTFRLAYILLLFTFLSRDHLATILYVTDGCLSRFTAVSALLDYLPVSVSRYAQRFFCMPDKGMSCA